MKKVLIATQNKDKFNIVKKILNSSDEGIYDCYSLRDMTTPVILSEEEGTVQNRAFNKAMETFKIVGKDQYEYIVGIDDGIEIRGEIIENVKDYINDILNNNYLKENEIINIVRAYCFAINDNEYYEITTKIPFKYIECKEKINIKANTYPLSNVMAPLYCDKSVVNLTEEETNNYYLQYSKEKIEEVLNDKK